MTENYRIHTSEQDSGNTKKKPGHRRLRRFFLFLAILLVVLGVVVVAAYRDGTGFDALRRFFSYGTAEKQGGTVSYAYDAAADNRFAALGDALVVLSGRELQVLDGEGKQAYSQSVAMTSPALSSNGTYAVAYDIGGTELYLVDAKGELLHLTADSAEPYISATLNSSGYLAVTAEKKNYKGSVSVYDAKQNLVFAFNSSERFLMDAVVTESCKTLAAVTLGQSESVFLSSVVLYSLSDTQPSGSYDVSDSLVLAIGESDGAVVTLSDTGLTFAGEDGNIQASYDYQDWYLRGSSLTGDGFSVLLLNRYRSGSAGKLVSVNPDGTERGTLEIDSEVRDLSAAGRYIAVLYADKLVIYNPELQEYASLTGIDSAKEVVMRSDGSALLISSDQAKLYLP